MKTPTYRLPDFHAAIWIRYTSSQTCKRSLALCQCGQKLLACLLPSCGHSCPCSWEAVLGVALQSAQPPVASLKASAACVCPTELISMLLYCCQCSRFGEGAHGAACQLSRGLMLALVVLWRTGTQCQASSAIPITWEIFGRPTEIRASLGPSALKEKAEAMYGLAQQGCTEVLLFLSVEMCFL